MNKTKQPVKNPLPKKLNITIGIDVSTKTTGYALLLNGKPFQLLNGQYLIGQLSMRKTEMKMGQVSFTDKTKVMKKKEVEYKRYGDQMFHGAFEQIQILSASIYQVIKEINTIIGNAKLANINYEKSKQAMRVDVPEVTDFTIVYEISEIPNFGKFSSTQNITTVRKLALYNGMVQYALSSMIHNAGFHFAHLAKVKLISPIEWQDRLWEKQGNRIATKAKSVETANKLIKKWGLQEIPAHMDDMADAINIASVADQVRDDITVRAESKRRKVKQNVTINRDIFKTKGKINTYKAQALDAKNETLDNIIWTIDKDFDKLPQEDKRKYSKYSKMPLEDVRLREAETFLTPAKQRKLADWKKQVIKLEAELKELRNGKVIK